eukprot:1513990-Pyramimonas_sp.AAC.1
MNAPYRLSHGAIGPRSPGHRRDEVVLRLRGIRAILGVLVWAVGGRVAGGGVMGSLALGPTWQSALRGARHNR